MSLFIVGNTKLDCDPYDKLFKRYNCDIYRNGEDISASLVKSGYAWDYRTFSKGKYQVLEQEARANKVGLWKDKTPVSPYCWRHPAKAECQDLQYQP